MKLTKRFQVGGKSVKVIKRMLMITALGVMMAVTMSFVDSCFYIPWNNCENSTTTTMKDFAP
jgi:hypothetical protein